MRWTEISLTVPPSLAEAVSAALTEAGCSGIVVHDPSARSSDPFAQWIDDTPAPVDNPDCRVCAYHPANDRLESVLDDIRQRLDLLREAGLDFDPEITLRLIDETAWSEAWKAYFKPLRVGKRFVIKPSWEEWNAAPDDLIIELDPGMAFGSGTHPTTQLCLALLEDVIRPGLRVLDWGTGSGILALGAALLGAGEIVAVDLDPVAVRVTTENAERNDFATVIHASEGSIEAVPAEPPFDCVIANIVADPIIAGATEIRKHLRPGGRAVISGIIDRREADVIQALEAAGLKLLENRAKEEWRGLLFTTA